MEKELETRKSNSYENKIVKDPELKNEEFHSLKNEIFEKAKELNIYDAVYQENKENDDAIIDCLINISKKLFISHIDKDILEFLDVMNSMNKIYKADISDEIKYYFIFSDNISDKIYEILKKKDIYFEYHYDVSCFVNAINDLWDNKIIETI